MAGGRRWTTLLFALATLVLGGYVAWEKFGQRLGLPVATQPARSEGVRLMRVVAEHGADGRPVLTATGKIVSDHRVEVATKVSGQIVGLYFEQGDRVAEGQILARIEDVAYRARRDEAAARLAQAQANLAYQEVNLARVLRLHEQAQCSDIELAEARRAFEDARASIEANEAALAFANKLLRDCEVVAPIAGVVLERNVEVGDFVAAEGGRGAMANSQFGAIADMTRLRVEVDVSELDIGRLRADMPCTVIPDANKERRYRGHVLWIDPGANYAKATVQVKVRIDDPDEHLRIEGAAQVQFFDQAPDARLATQPARIWIPLAACQLDESGTAGSVRVSENGSLRERRVALGQRTATQAEVLGGLREGEEIAAEWPRGGAGD